MGLHLLHEFFMWYWFTQKVKSKFFLKKNMKLVLAKINGNNISAIDANSCIFLIKISLIYHVNHLPADDSHEIPSLFWFLKNRKMINVIYCILRVN